MSLDSNNLEHESHEFHEPSGAYFCAYRIRISRIESRQKFGGNGIAVDQI